MTLPALNSEDRITINSEVFEGTQLANAFKVSQKGEILMSVFHRYNTTKAEIIKLDKSLSEYSTLAPSYLIKKSNSVEGAIKELDCTCWKEAIDLTEVNTLMSQADSDEWFYRLKDKNVPAFDREIVLDTLNEILNQSQTYFARKVDEVFKALSSNHSTNPAHAFGSKMIFTLLDGIGYIPIQKSGKIDDLRNVIAMFLGLEPVVRGSTGKALDVITRQNRYGEWFDLDMGVLRIKIFKKGTAHLSVHEDISWRLNEVLASLYGLSIPEKFKNDSRSSKKPLRFIFPTDRIISNNVIEFLEKANNALDFNGNRPKRIPNSVGVYRADSLSKTENEELVSVLEACGGVSGDKGMYYTFDYDFIEDVKPYIMGNRCYPDKFTHQFITTYKELAEQLVEMAEIEEGHECCEPSAGVGSIAKLMPKSTVCVEISGLRCEALKAMGFENVISGDFLEWSQLSQSFDRIVMNPPYHKRTGQVHIDAAKAILRSGGILTAVIPTTLISKLDTTGFNAEWSEPFKFKSNKVSPTVRTLKLVRD